MTSFIFRKARKKWLMYERACKCKCIEKWICHAYSQSLHLATYFWKCCYNPVLKRTFFQNVSKYKVKLILLNYYVSKSIKRRLFWHISVDWYALATYFSQKFQNIYIKLWRDSIFLLTAHYRSEHCTVNLVENKKNKKNWWLLKILRKVGFGFTWLQNWEPKKSPASQKTLTNWRKNDSTT